MSVWVSRLCGLGLMLCAGVASRAQAYEYEEPWREDEVVLPAAPDEASLIAFDVGTPTTNRFYIDGSTISVGGDGVVRFVMVVRAPSGVKNVSFEGLRCRTRERKLYAVWQASGRWSDVVRSQWQTIENNNLNRPHAVLAHQHFCDHRMPLGDVDAVRATFRPVRW